MDANNSKNGPARKKGKTREPDITFFHPDLLEVPADGGPAFLKAYRCRKCGQLDFPKLQRCPGCWGDSFEMQPLSRTGTLYSVTDVYIGQPGMQIPYTFGYVDLPEELRIFAQLEGETGSFQCDDLVELTVGPIRMNRDGEPMTSYKFRKQDSGTGSGDE